MARNRNARNANGAFAGAQPGQGDMQPLMDLYNRGRLGDAEKVARQLIKKYPRAIVLYNVLGAAQAGQKKFREAAATHKRVLKQAPDYPEAHYNRGVALQELGKNHEAASHYRRALALRPEMIEARSNLGVVLQVMGQLEEAVSCHRKVLQAWPEYDGAHNNLGNALKALGELDDAVSCYRQALTLRPDLAEAHNNLGTTLQLLEHYEEAAACHHRALSLDPDHAEAHNNLGNALRKLGQPDKAFSSYVRALELQPDLQDALFNLGMILHERGKLEEAVARYEQAIGIDPDYIDAHNNLGIVLQELGRMDEAVACFKKSIAINPEYCKAYRNLVNVEKYTRQDAYIEKMEALFSKESTDSPDKIDLGFALGKVFEDLGEYEKSFPYLLEGNRLKREEFTYSLSDSEFEFRKPREIFSAEFIQGNMREGNSSESPVFIIGMPRSGTSLVEQILASHPGVYGAGELDDFKNVLLDELKRMGLPYPDGMSGLNEKAHDRIANNYLQRLKGHGGDAQRITDKMPHNFRYVGLIKTVLPKARIIHVRRDPMDTCLSIYSHYFIGRHLYAYDQKELGGYYRHYQELMEHWREVIPEGMTDVDYEKLIEDPEEQIRQLLDFCDLPFDPACLEFHKTERDVRTASFAQVRQPLYRSSVDRWRRYEKQLEPLRAALRG